MDSTTLIIVALVGLWAVIFIVSGIMMLARRRIPAPEVALWPPTYFFPDWVEDEGPRTQEVPVAKLRQAPHSGVPATNATNPQTPPDWRHSADNSSDLTMAEGMEAVDPTNLKSALRDSSHPAPAQASPSSPYFDDEDTSKVPSPARGVPVSSLTSKIPHTKEEPPKPEPKGAQDAKAGDEPSDEQKPKQ
jgi:hypothetical protein